MFYAIGADVHVLCHRSRRAWDTAVQSHDYKREHNNNIQRSIFDLNTDATNDLPTSYRVRPVSMHNSIEGIIAIRSLGGERLPAASYGLRLNLQKVQFFAIGEESRVFSSVSNTLAAKCIFIRRLAGSRHIPSTER